MAELLTEHWLTLVFGLLSAGALAYAKYIANKFKKYKELEQEDEQDKLNILIEEKLKPIQNRLEDDLNRFNSIKDYYRYLIVEECTRLLNKGSMTAQEYQKLSEIFKAYHGIGGNSQAEDFYHRASKLPVKNEDEVENENKGEGN